MANDRIYARCTWPDCAWRVMLFKYYPDTGIYSQPAAVREMRAYLPNVITNERNPLDVMAEHWASHDQDRDLFLVSPGFRLATEADVDPQETDHDE